MDIYKISLAKHLRGETFKRIFMKKSNILIKLIEVVAKLPMPKTLREFFYKKLHILAYRSAFEDDIPFMSILKEQWEKYSWLFQALTCLVSLSYLIQKVIF